MATPRRWLLAALALGALLVSYPLFIESMLIETTRTRVPMPLLQRPVRILHLSDLHLGDGRSQAALEEIAQRAVADARPDLICLTGDYVGRQTALKKGSLAAPIAVLAKAAPTYAVLGNHDGGLWAARYGDVSNLPIRQQLEKGGAVVLHNQHARIEVAGQPLLIVGLGDLWSQESRPEEAFAGAPTGLPTLLLVHNPDAKDQAARYPWHLMLAGHTHGNQVNLPFWDEPWATVRDQRFIAGHHHWNGRQLYVNRGMGGIAGIRFRSRPEITVLELAPTR